MQVLVTNHWYLSTLYVFTLEPSVFPRREQQTKLIHQEIAAGMVEMCYHPYNLQMNDPFNLQKRKIMFWSFSVNLLLFNPPPLAVPNAQIVHQKTENRKLTVVVFLLESKLAPSYYTHMQ